MPTAVLSREIARRYTAGETRVEFDSDQAPNVRALVRELDARFPGLGPVLRTDMAIAIDGQIFQDALLESIQGKDEICFMPAIEAG